MPKHVEDFHGICKKKIMPWKIRAVYLHSEAHQWFFISCSVNFKSCALYILFMTWSIFKSFLWIIFPFPLVWLHVFRWFSFLGGSHFESVQTFSMKYHSPSHSESCSSQIQISVCTILVLLKIMNVTCQSYFPSENFQESTQHSSLIFRFYYKADNILC